MKRMRKRLIWSAVFALVLAFVIPTNLHRRDFDRAFSEWLHHPSSASEAELRHQQHLNEVENLKFEGAVALLIFASLSTALLVHVKITEKISK